MALSTNDEARVREYLLGQLSDEEQLKIEERLMIEDELFQELKISQKELIEDYRSGDLTQEEREWFEQNFLATPEGKQKYTFVLALDGLERPTSQTAPASLTGLFPRVPSWTSGAIIPIAVLLVIGIAVVLYRMGQPATFVSLDLPITSLTRDAADSQPPPLVQVDHVDELRVSLLLPPNAPAANGYRARLLESDDTSDGKEVQVVGHDSRKVSIVIPSDELPSGKYAVKLIAIKPDGSEERITDIYFFNIK